MELTGNGKLKRNAETESGNLCVMLLYVPTVRTSLRQGRRKQVSGGQAKANGSIPVACS